MKAFSMLCPAIKEVLQKNNFRALFVVLSFLFATFLILIPVFAIGGNDFLFQLGVFTLKDYLLISTLSLLIGLMITMQIYNYKKTKRLEAGKSVVGSSSAIMAALFGTAACSSCLAALFGFLGVTNILFLLEHKMYVVLVSTTLILISLYFTARKINCKGGCK